MIGAGYRTVAVRGGPPSVAAILRVIDLLAQQFPLEVDVMANDKIGREQLRLEAQKTRDKTESEGRVDEKDRRLTEESRVLDEAARGEAEQLMRG